MLQSQVEDQDAEYSAHLEDAQTLSNLVAAAATDGSRPVHLTGFQHLGNVARSAVEDADTWILSSARSSVRTLRA